MKKVCIFILSLVCCLALAACFNGGGNTTPQKEDNVFLVDKEITVFVGGTYRFEPTGADSFTYKSSDENVAKVTQSGLLTGMSDGTAFVDVSAGKASVTCKVNVIKAKNYIRLNATDLTAAAGSDVTIKAEVITDGKITNDKVDFDYGLSESLTVKNGGFNTIIVSIEQSGNYVITVSAGSLKAECKIKAVNLTAKTLGNPEITVEDCKTVKWNAVENASAYAYSINGGEWIKTEQTSFSAQDITDGLKYKDKAIFAVKALSGENDFDYIDGLPVSIDFSHKYNITTIEDYTCAIAGKVSFKCSVCDKEYIDENYLADHVMIDGVCKVCGLQQTKKIVYRYDENNDCYFVVGADAGFDSEDVYLRAKYNDGEHGERDVKYIGFGAFKSNKTIKRVILPASMTEFVDADAKFNKTPKVINGEETMVSSPLRGQAFDDCSNLEYVSMKGVTVLRDLADSAYAHWNFRDCYNLKQVVVGNGFDNYGATFMRWVYTPDTSENQTDIYVYGDKITKLCNDSYPIGYDLGFGNNTLLTGDVFYYDKNSTDCYKWHFDADGVSIITGGKHVFNNKNKCKKCGAMNDFGVKYGYYESTDKTVKTYYVSDNQTLNKTEIVILDEYTDGTHGTLPVTFVKNQAFAGNPTIKKVTLSKNITRLDGGVFMLCENLEYVSMTGITDMAFVNLSGKYIYGSGVDSGNNFLNCYKLKYLVVNEKFNLYTDVNAQQFIGTDSKKPACIDIYSIGSAEESVIKAAPNAKNNLLTGTVYYYGSLNRCERWIEEDGIIDTSAKKHNFVNEECTICGERNAHGVVYSYYNGSYYVAGYTGSDETVNVFGTWNDGEHGEANVTFVANSAFSGNTSIKKVILHENITALDGSVFQDCSNLEYVSMKGVTNLQLLNISNTKIYTGECYTSNNFMNCGKLTVVVVGKNLNVDPQMFKIHDNDSLTACVNIYAEGAEGECNIVLSDDQNALLTKKVYYYSETKKSGCWHYENGVAALWS